MPTVVDLGEAKKRQRPGAYDDMDSAALGRAVKAKYPGQYDDFTEPVQAQSQQQPGVIERFFGQGLNPVFHSLDQLSDSSTPLSERIGNVVTSIPGVQPLMESAHAFNRLTGIEPQNSSSTARDLLRAVPGASLVQDPIEQMGSGDVAGGLGSLTQTALGATMARRGSTALHYPEPIQPFEEGVRNVWNPKTKEFEPPPSPPPGGTLAHAIRAATPDVVKGAAKLGGGIAVSHFLPHWAQAMMGYPEYSGAKQIGEGFSKGYQAYTPPPTPGVRMMNITPFDMGAPEPPSTLSTWQPPEFPPNEPVSPGGVTLTGRAVGGPQNIPAAPGEPGGPPPPALKRSDVLPVWANVREPQVVAPGLVEPTPATATPRGAIPGGIWNQPAPAPPPTRWVSPYEGQVAPSQLTPLPPVDPIPATATPRGAVPGGIQNQAPAPPPLRIVGGGAQFQPSPPPDLPPVSPIPATVTPSGRSVPSVESRIARASTPVEPTVTVSVDTAEGVKKVQVPASAITQPPAAAPSSARAVALTKGKPTATSTFAPVGTPAPSQAELFQPPTSATAQPALAAPFANPLESQVSAVPPVATAPAQGGLLQNLMKTVQESPDRNAEAIAEHAGNIGHGLTTNKNAVMAQHLLGQGIDADKWSALPMDDKQAWVKKINAAQKKSYKPFGADFRPGGYGRPAEEGARQVEDALRVLGAQPPQ